MSDLVPAPRMYAIALWGGGVMKMASQTDLCKAWADTCQDRLKDGKWALPVLWTGIGEGRVQIKFVMQAAAIQGVVQTDDEVRL